MQKQAIINIIIIVILVAGGLFFIFKNHGVVLEKDAKCIGKRAKLFIQTGCPVCQRQKDIFGENLKYLDITDCILTPEKCEGKITKIPTWEIDGNFYQGFMAIDELKNLTGC